MDAFYEKKKEAEEQVTFGRSCDHLFLSHYHINIEILIVRRGGYEVTIDGTTYLVKEGDIVFFDSYCIHSYDRRFPIPDGKTDDCVLVIPSKLFGPYDRMKAGRYIVSPIIHDPKLVDLLLTISDEIFALPHNDETYAYAAKFVLALIAEKLKYTDRVSKSPNEDERELIHKCLSYIEKNYVDFLKKGSDNEFDMSHTVLRKRLFPILNNDFPVFFILIDNLRYDHWKVLQQRMQPYLKTLSEDTYMSILPSVTHYARNSMFAGLLPSEIEKKYPDYWVAEDSGQYKNQNEKLLLEECLKRFGKEPNFTYNKVLNQSYGLKIIDYLPKMMSTPLNIIIYNFIDMLSHASTEIELLREMANDDDSYRSLVGSWFDHSPLLELIKNLANRKAIVIITSDHGSIRITNPVRIKGDRETSVNLRYKVGRNLEFNPKEVFSIRNPGEIFLPKVNITSSFVFCRQNDFFVYPNNFNQYVAYYRNTIQHGGISLEEMLVPYAVLQPK